MMKIYSEKDKYGHIYWYKEGTNILHKDDGPAIEYADGEKRWYQDGKLHRIDGPAIKFAGGSETYWLYGKYYPNINSDKEWIIFQIIN